MGLGLGYRRYPINLEIYMSSILSAQRDDWTGRHSLPVSPFLPSSFLHSFGAPLRSATGALTQRAIALVLRYAKIHYLIVHIVAPYGAFKHFVFGTEGFRGKN